MDSFGLKIKVFPAFFFFVLFGLFLFWLPEKHLAAQESILSSYQRNFARAGLQAKAGILKDAATDERAEEFIGELYEFALQFALVNAQLFRDDPDMISLVGVAARGAGVAGNTDSVRSLWDLFSLFRDSYTRVEILQALGILGRGNAQIAANLNQFLENYNRAFRAGNRDIDYHILAACIAALRLIGDDSSFPFLFSTLIAGHPQAIVQEALWALDSLQGNFTEYLAYVIRNNPFNEKAIAFRIGVYSERLSYAEIGEIAQIALEVSLDAHGSVENSLRYDSVVIITRLTWTPAAPLLIRNFYRVQTDFANGAASRERLLEAIASLVAMNSVEAAQSLALQLAFVNSQTERTGEYDEAVVLALIQALGELGNRAAFDHLLYVSFLNYPDIIQAAAREALNRLQW